MKRSVPILLTLAASLLLLAARPAAAEDAAVAAPPPLAPQVQNDVRFLSGGVGDQEQKRLRALDDDYSLRLALTKPDGAYLSGIHVVIEDAAGQALLETTTRGPILLADLRPGRYVLRASHEGRTSERRVIDVPTRRDQVRLYVALAEE